jgi:hypothetical protein
MLRTCVAEGKENVVSWLPDGNAFKVHNVPEFVSNILPSYFKQTKYKSFQRQLNLWGFERLTSGPDKGAYYHKEFLRDEPDLCRNLTRQRARKGGASAPAASGGRPVTSPVKPKATKVVTVGAPNAAAGPIIVPQALEPASALAAAALPAPNPASAFMPRQVSESSLESFGDLLLDLDPSNPDAAVLEHLAEFEGFTFHLLEQERYEELNLEFKFNPSTTTTSLENAVHQQQNHHHQENALSLLQELEQGMFGTPKTDFDASENEADRKRPPPPPSVCTF